MKIMVAQSSAGKIAGLAGYGEALGDFLTSEGHKVQSLDLPPIAAPDRTLTNVVSLRLLGTAESAEALICLDPVAALLRHPRKLVWLLDDAYLDGDPIRLAEEHASACSYLANVLRASIAEASAIFSPSRFGLKKLRVLSFDDAQLLRPELPQPPTRYARNPGSELLVLNVLGDRQRPDLLIACLAALPEPFRARWIAPSEQPGTVTRLRRLAQEAGVEQRLVIEVRSIDAGEQAYLLAHAAALLELAQDAVATTCTVQNAIRCGVPVIACNDGGALTEIYSGRASRKPAKPEGAALAQAVLSACALPDEKSSRSAPLAKPRVTSWIPLAKALSE